MALADFFKTLEAEGGSGPQFLIDHPNPENRELAIQKQIQNWPAVTYQPNSAAFTKLSQHAAGVKAYTAEEIAQGATTGQWDSLNKKTGAVFQPASAGVTATTTPATLAATPATTVKAVSLNEVLPSSKLVTADLGVMRIGRPENWDVIPPLQNCQFVTIALRQGVIREGIGYGVVMNAASGTAKKATIDQMTAEIVRSLQSSGDMKTVGNTKTITVAGVRGRSVIMQSTSPFADGKGLVQREKDWLVTIPRPDGSVFFLVFVAPETEFQHFQPTFEKMVKSVKF